MIHNFTVIIKEHKPFVYFYCTERSFLGFVRELRPNHFKINLCKERVCIIMANLFKLLRIMLYDMGIHCNAKLL